MLRVATHRIGDARDSIYKLELGGAQLILPKDLHLSYLHCGKVTRAFSDTYPGKPSRRRNCFDTFRKVFYMPSPEFVTRNLVMLSHALHLPRKLIMYRYSFRCSGYDSGADCDFCKNHLFCAQRQ